MSSFLMDYPFAKRLFPFALDVLRRLSCLGRTVILSDGDVVLQPRKIEHAGLSAAVDGRVLMVGPARQYRVPTPGEHRARPVNGRRVPAGRPYDRTYRGPARL